MKHTAICNIIALTDDRLLADVQWGKQKLKSLAGLYLGLLCTQGKADRVTQVTYFHL